MVDLDASAATMVNGNEDLVELFGITGQLDSRRYLMARVQGCIQFAQVAEADSETASPNCFLPV